MDPIHIGIDQDQIAAAAATTLHGTGQVAVIETSETFAEVTETLMSQGYKRDGQLLHSEGSRAANPTQFHVIADAGHGVFVLAVTEDIANAVLSQSETGPTANLLDSVRGVARVAKSVNDPNAACLRGIAAGEDLEPAQGELIFQVSDPTEATSASLTGWQRNRFLRPIQLEEVTAEDREVRATATYDPKETLGPVAVPEFLGLPTSTYFRCR